MRKYILAALLVFVASGAQASSYLDVFGTVHDPIQIVGSGGLHAYAGTNLQPSADLTSAGLTSANLVNADLTSANLTFANLTGADLTDADLLSVNLTGAILFGATLIDATLFLANLSFATLSGVDLSGAVLSNAVGLGSSFGSAFYDANTDFTGTSFDPVAAGWMLVAVPEPGTALLTALGLAGLAVRRR